MKCTTKKFGFSKSKLKMSLLCLNHLRELATGDGRILQRLEMHWESRVILSPVDTREVIAWHNPKKEHSY
jgi:hypothetical protein